MTSERHPGPLALVGGREWGDGCTFDARLLADSGGDEVLILPTAAAYEHPQRAVERATAWFAALGAKVRGLMVLSRADAEDDDNARAVREARFVYLADGSPMHVRSVLKQSKVWHALDQAWEDGAVVAGSGAGAMILGDPMIDPRGGAFTIGLALVELVAVLPAASTWSAERLRRTVSLAPADVALVALDEATAVIRERTGDWTCEGVGSVDVHVGGVRTDLSALPR
jgi:cyanophycinase